MKLNSRLPFRQGPGRTNLATSTILLTLLTLIKIILTQQFNTHNSQESLDEEITIEPRHDYEEISVDYSTSPTTHGFTATIPGAAADQRQSPLQIFNNNDPFAVTFEDYLREASKSSVHHFGGDKNESSFASVTAIPDTAGLIIEDDENLIKPKLEQSPIIDYIFPPSKQETVYYHKEDAKRMEKQTDKDSNLSGLLNEIRLLFAWKQLPTNKCSKTCGKGLRVNHISCVDLKYDVRVEDELCHKSKIRKPNETSDEPCNEIDCPPQWNSVEFQECNPVASKDGICHLNSYKRVQCTMINKSGVSVYLDDTKCNSTKGFNALVISINETQVIETRNQSKSRAQVLDDDNMDINADYINENGEKNDILSNIDVGGAVESLMYGLSKTTKSHPQNEPFFEAGSWSECSGAPCGQLGKRFRKLTCRLYLSRSSKYAEVPETSCHNAPIPDNEEPCYIDCDPEKSLDVKNLPKAKYNDSENNDETVYDLEMTRFIWQKDGWTKCSVDCLGGQRESIIECWDKVVETTVDPSLCNQELRPHPVTETCNDIPCPPEWKVEAFSRCTKSCGSAGIKSRSIACVQQVTLQGTSSFLIVSNDLCIQTNGSTPHKLEPCNRIDCRPEWSVGPWSECSTKCGHGVRNRTVICVQEFANRDGPKPESSHNYPYRLPNRDLLEAVTVSAKNWHPGKVTQVSFHECYEEYRTVPALDERCFNSCEKETYIEAVKNQNYHINQEALKRKTVTLRIGGKAQLPEGRNLRIRCRIMNRQVRENLVKKVSEQVEWCKDGIKIFLNGSTVADKLYIPDDNLIFGNDIFADEKNQFMADEPNSKRAVIVANSRNQSKPRNLIVRSWNNYPGFYLGSKKTFNFVPQIGGRFSLVKENTLRIKRLRSDDSGTYTCSYGSLSESLELKVVGQRDSLDTEEKLANNLGL